MHQLLKRSARQSSTKDLFTHPSISTAFLSQTKCCGREFSLHVTQSLADTPTPHREHRVVDNGDIAVQKGCCREAALHSNGGARPPLTPRDCAVPETGSGDVVADDGDV